MRTTIQIGFISEPYTMTVEHQFPLSQKWLDDNRAVIMPTYEPKEVTR